MEKDKQQWVISCFYHASVFDFHKKGKKYLKKSIHFTSYTVN